MDYIRLTINMNQTGQPMRSSVIENPCLPAGFLDIHGLPLFGEEMPTAIPSPLKSQLQLPPDPFFLPFASARLFFCSSTFSLFLFLSVSFCLMICFRTCLSQSRKLQQLPAGCSGSPTTLVQEDTHCWMSGVRPGLQRLAGTVVCLDFVDSCYFLRLWLLHAIPKLL